MSRTANINSTIIMNQLCEDDGIKFLGFNVDNDFSDCVDGFILVDIAKIKDSVVQRYITKKDAPP